MSQEALINEFLLESFENISSIDNDLTALEKNPGEKELLNKIYRTVHTMKGSASFLNYTKLQELTHTSENLLDLVREDKLPFTSTMADVLLKSFDLCQKILKSIENDKTEGDSDIEPLCNELNSLMNPQEESSKEDVDDDMDGLISSHLEDSKFISQVSDTKEAVQESQDEPLVNQGALESLGDSIIDGTLDRDMLENLSGAEKDFLEKYLAASEGAASSEAVAEEAANEQVVTPEVVAPEKVEEKAPEPVKAEKIEPPVPQIEDERNQDNVDIKQSVVDAIVRVNVEVLDKIMNTVGELVLNRNQVLQHANLMDDPTLTRLAHQLNVITSELQGDIMSMRMQPVGGVFSKFERLVRDYSRSNGKQIELKLSGQETELDKTLIEAVKDPLVHIVRNAIDHGLESSDDRKLAGKSEKGHLAIKAYNENGQVTIEITDDGRGLNKERILQKAIEKGVITSEQASNMTDEQVFTLIFAPGFSTAEQVTNISGRGVGMDVVRTNIEKIGGSVAVSSVLNKGTSFKLRIPLTLAIVPALMVRSFKEIYAIPQLNLVELVRFEKDDNKNVEVIDGKEFIRLRGQLTPIFRISESLDVQSVQERAEKINLSQEKNPTGQNISKLYDADSLNIVILNSGNTTYGIVVDEILETQEVVVKPLDTKLKELGVFGGATILGDGKVALIVDSDGFLNTFSEKNLTQEDDNLEEVVKKDYEINLAEASENLLFSLNDQNQYGVPLTLVSRLEEFITEKVQFVGEKPIIRYLGKAMPLIDLRSMVGQDVEKENQFLERENFSCIVTKINGTNYGLVVHDIVDIATSHSEIDSSAQTPPGILGSLFIDDKAINLVDIFNVVRIYLGMPPEYVSDKAHNEEANKYKILLVDDSSMYRKIESDAFLLEGYEVIVAIDGEDAYNKLMDHKDVNIIVTDIEMPVCDGFEFTKRVRENSEFINIPIIALTSRVSEKDLKIGKEVGLTEHLEKFDRENVLMTVKRVLDSAA